jgi:hypothetical protein
VIFSETLKFSSLDEFFSYFTSNTGRRAKTQIREFQKLRKEPTGTATNGPEEQVAGRNTK